MPSYCPAGRMAPGCASALPGDPVGARQPSSSWAATHIHSWWRSRAVCRDRRRVRLARCLHSQWQASATGRWSPSVESHRHPQPFPSPWQRCSLPIHRTASTYCRDARPLYLPHRRSVSGPPAALAAGAGQASGTRWLGDVYASSPTAQRMVSDIETVNGFSTT